MKLLLIGSTGLVGSHVLQQALGDDRISLVVVLSRSPLIIEPQAKLKVILVNFDALPTIADWWQVDAVICTLGTTIKKAHTKENFKRVDHDYPLDVAQLARKHGARCYVLNSAMGANVSSRIFYNQVKGHIEQDLAELSYPSLYFVRPGLISGQRTEKRLGEQLMVNLFSLLNPVLPKSIRLNPSHVIARAMLDAAHRQQQGTHIISAKQLS